jgi:hypothetical protein
MHGWRETGVGKGTAHAGFVFQSAHVRSPAAIPACHFDEQLQLAALVVHGERVGRIGGRGEPALRAYHGELKYVLAAGSAGRPRELFAAFIRGI